MQIPLDTHISGRVDIVDTNNVLDNVLISAPGNHTVLYNYFDGTKCVGIRKIDTDKPTPRIYLYFNVNTNQSVNFDVTLSNLCLYQGDFTNPPNLWSYDNDFGNPYNNYFILDSLYRHYKSIDVYDSGSTNVWQRLLCMKPTSGVMKYTIHATLSLSNQQHGPVVSFIGSISEGTNYGKITILHTYPGNGQYAYMMRALRFASNTTDGYIYLEVKHNYKTFNYYILNWFIDINWTSSTLEYMELIKYYNSLNQGTVNNNDVLVNGSETNITFS